MDMTNEAEDKPVVEDKIWRYLARIPDLLHVVSRKGASSEHFGRVTLNQARIFGYIFEHHGEGIRMKTLAHDLDVTPAAVSQAIDRLVNAGLASREPDPDDRRAAIVRMTEKSQSLYRRAVLMHRGRFARILADVPKEDVDAFVRVLETIYTHLAEEWFAILAEKDAARDQATPDASNGETTP